MSIRNVNLSRGVGFFSDFAKIFGRFLEKKKFKKIRFRTDFAENV